MRLKGMLTRDDSISHLHVRHQSFMYSLDVLTEWLSRNEHRFSFSDSNVKVDDSEFYCGTNSHYVKSDEMGASGKRCISCDAKVAKANKAKSMEHTGRGKVPAHILKFETRKSNMAFKIEDKAINDINSWMND
jgi:hypothetical protein